LIGNVLNNAKHFTYIFSLSTETDHGFFEGFSIGLDRVDGCNHFADRCGTIAGLFFSHIGGGCGSVGMLRNFGHSGVHFFHGCGCFCGSIPLFYRSVAGTEHRVSKLLRSIRQAFRNIMGLQSRLVHTLVLVQNLCFPGP